MILVVMKPLVDEPALRRLSLGAKLTSFTPFFAVAWGVVVLVGMVLVFFFVASPEIRSWDRADKAQQRLQSQWARAHERFDQQRREILGAQVDAGFDEQESRTQALGRIDAQAGRWLKRWRTRCRASAADDSFCTIRGRP